MLVYQPTMEYREALLWRITVHNDITWYNHYGGRNLAQYKDKGVGILEEQLESYLELNLAYFNYQQEAEKANSKQV